MLMKFLAQTHSQSNLTCSVLVLVNFRISFLVGMGRLTRALRSLFYSDEPGGFNTRSGARFVDAAHVTDDVQTAERFRRHYWFCNNMT